MVNYTEDHKLNLIYLVMKLMINFMRYTLLAGVFVIPLMLVITVVTILQFEGPIMGLKVLIQYLSFFNPGLRDTGEFSGQDNEIVQFFSPILIGFALVTIIAKWIIEKVTGINISISLKQKFWFLTVLITIIHIAAGIAFMLETKGNDVYFIIVGFYLFSVISTIIYITLESVLERIDLVFLGKPNKHVVLK